MVNLSDRTLGKHENALLSRGLNFSTAPSKIPKEDIVDTEALARRLDRREPGRGTLLTHRIQRCLEDLKQPTDNLPKQERKALKMLKDDKDIMIPPAGKGNAKVLLNADDYTNKVKLILEDRTYN